MEKGANPQEENSTSEEPHAPAQRDKAKQRPGRRKLNPGRQKHQARNAQTTGKRNRSPRARTQIIYIIMYTTFTIYRIDIVNILHNVWKTEECQSQINYPEFPPDG